MADHTIIVYMDCKWTLAAGWIEEFYRKGQWAYQDDSQNIGQGLEKAWSGKKGKLRLDIAVTSGATWGEDAETHCGVQAEMSGVIGMFSGLPSDREMKKKLSELEAYLPERLGRATPAELAASQWRPSV